MSIISLANAAAARRTDTLGTLPDGYLEIAKALAESPRTVLRDAPTGPNGPKDGQKNNVEAALNVLFGYIPTEVVTLYVAVLAVIKETGPHGALIAFWAFLVATPIVIWLAYGIQVKAAGLPTPVAFAEWPVWEMFAGTVAYTAWALALPQAPIPDHLSTLAGVMVMITSVALGLLAPYFQRSLKPKASDEAAGNQVRDAHVAAQLTRPTFSALKAVYTTDSANIHACSMTFPNTCAIRMSEALDQAVPGIKAKFAASGLNTCPHKFMRGAEDLAAVLRRPDVFGNRDIGFENPGAAPAAIAGKTGIVAYINIPGFDGQGHIDLWDGSKPVGSAYWNANPIWFWELS